MDLLPYISIYYCYTLLKKINTKITHILDLND